MVSTCASRPAFHTSCLIHVSCNNRADGSTSPHYGLSGRCTQRDGRGDGPCWCVSALPLLLKMVAYFSLQPDILCHTSCCPWRRVCGTRGLQFDYPVRLSGVAPLCACASYSILFHSAVSVGLTKCSDYLLPGVCSQLLTHPAQDVRDYSSIDDQSPLSTTICACIVSQDLHLGAKAHYFHRFDCRVVDERRFPHLWCAPFSTNSLQRFDPQSLPRNRHCT